MEGKQRTLYNKRGTTNVTAFDEIISFLNSRDYGNNEREATTPIDTSGKTFATRQFGVHVSVAVKSVYRDCAILRVVEQLYRRRDYNAGGGVRLEMPIVRACRKRNEVTGPLELSGRDSVHAL